MKIQVRAENPLRVDADAVAVPIYSDGEVPDAVKALDKPLGGLLRDMFRGGEIKGREDELHVLPSVKLKAKRVFVVGLGPAANRTGASMARFAGAGVRAAQRRRAKSIAFVLPELKGVDPEQLGELFAEGALMATFEPAPYRTKEENPRTEVASVTLLVPRGADERDRIGIDAERLME